jgi:alkanesulfonate monooxygenase SsuD/methylene tetrahydromethanopterin reductase-like flavin-dependent oxidoreductase (luciferase family)
VFAARPPRTKHSGALKHSDELELDIQLNPSRLGWPALRDLALAAESAGYGAVFAYDHLAGVTLGGHTMLETFALLGALAVATTTIELGTLVVNVNNRTPALLALAAASVVAISGRHLFLGLGAGTSPTSRWSAEMRAVGQPVIPDLSGRHERFSAVLDDLDRLFAADRPAELATFPMPDPRPTVLVGVSSVELAALAGRRADGVNVAWLGAHRDELLTAALAARADRPGFLLTAWAFWSPELVDPTGPERAAMLDCGIDRMVLVIPRGVGVRELSRPVS